jgi:glycosyltransferase involved in cell wall biosynthesis
LKKLIGAAKLVVLPLPYYNYSYGQMSLLQSMSMAKSVIVTRTPGVIDYVIDNKNGFFVNPYDINDLSEKIAKLLKNPKLSSAVGLNARITVSRDFNEKIMAERIYNFIMKTMARKKNLTTVNYVR